MVYEKWEKSFCMAHKYYIKKVSQMQVLRIKKMTQKKIKSQPVLSISDPDAKYDFLI